MSSARRLGLYFPTLAGGGAERLYLNLTPYFIDAGFVVTFILDQRKGELIDQLPAGVGLDHLDARRVRNAVPRLARYLRRQNYDLLLSSLSMSNMAALLANELVGARRPGLVITQHNTLTRERSHGGLFRALPILNRLMLGRAAAVVAVSRGVANDLARASRMPLDRIQIIPNGVITADFDTRMAAECPHPWLKQKTEPVFLGVGRLNSQKDFGTLVRAFGIVRQRRQTRLVILGEGPMRAELIALAQSLGIADSVDLPGYIANPLPYMRAADALVLASRHEGFGLVLAEALACGTPVVSTDCQYGPAEILGDGKFGALVPVGDWAAMAAAMVAVLGQSTPTQSLSARGREFSVATCAASYVALFERVLSRRLADGTQAIAGSRDL